MNTPKYASQIPLLFILFASALSIIASMFSIPLLYGIELYLINAVAWYAYKRNGLHTAFAVSLLGAVCGIFLFEQTPLLAFSPLEIVVVDRILRKTNNRSIMFGSLLYWLPTGILLHWLVFEGLNDFEARYVGLFLMIQLANGLINALIGEIAADNMPAYLIRSKRHQLREWRLDRVSFQLCVFLLTIPFVLFLIINGTFNYRNTLTVTSDKLQTIQAHLNENINRLTANELRGFKVHSALQKALLHKTFDNLTLNSNVQMILIDPSLQVISTSDPAVEDGQQGYNWKDGAEIRKLSATLYLWQPQSIPEYNSVSRWSASEFVTVTPLERLPDYQLIIKQPVVTFQQSVFHLYAVSLGLAFALIFIFAILALRATRKFSNSLTELAAFSSELPSKIRLRSPIEWKDSSVYEVNRLKDNIRHMSSELVNMFQEINESEEKLRHLAHYDALTGLANRYSFSHYLPALIQEAKAKGEQAACLFIDLDRFKRINDTMGHESGDAVLKAVGERLNPFKGETIKPFRLAGDEFVVVLSAPLPEHLEGWAALVQQALTSEGIQLGEQVLQLELSVGIALYPEHGQDAEGLLRSADQAMYEAKISGRNQIRMFKRASTGQRIGGALE